MAVLTGYLADVYAVTGAGTAMTDEACTLVSGTTYQINNVVKRVWDSATLFTVKDAAVATQIPYQLSRASGKIILQSAPAGAITVSGAYLATSQLGQSKKWSLTIDQNKVMTATFGDSWEEYTATTKKATATIERFYQDEYFFTNIGAAIVLHLYVKQSTGDRYMMIGRVTPTYGVENAGVNMDTLSVTSDGPVDYSLT